MAGSNRFATLDALRGVAAIGVMLFHSMPDSPLAIRGGYLAVDLFFGLSGFVIALTYEDRLRGGMGLREFLTLRAIRLWPMLVVGALLGMGLYQGSAGMLFLLPNPFSDTLYPSNPPLWSLLFEALAYLGFATFAYRLQLKGLLALLTGGGLALAAFALQGHALLQEFGGFWSTAPAGLARLCFSFTAGVVIYRLRQSQGLPRSRDRRAWLLAAAVSAVMLLITTTGSLAGLAAIFVIFPALIWLASKWELPSPRAGSLLGALSYPLYCIHMPILALTAAHGLPRPLVWAGLIAASLVLDRYWDRPARRWLHKLRAHSAAQTRIGIST